MPLTETEKSYLAGIIDGEGSISLCRSGARDSEAYIYPLLRVANTKKVLIDWITRRLNFGHRLYVSKLNIGCNDCYHWGVASSEAFTVIELVRPYLVIKAMQADVVLAPKAENEAALRITGRPQFSRVNRVPKWLLHWRNACFYFLQHLNNRGMKKPIKMQEMLKHINCMKIEESLLCH